MCTEGCFSTVLNRCFGTTLYYLADLHKLISTSAHLHITTDRDPVGAPWRLPEEQARMYTHSRSRHKLEPFRVSFCLNKLHLQKNANLKLFEPRKGTWNSETPFLI